MKRTFFILVVALMSALCVSAAWAADTVSITVDNDSKQVYQISEGFYQDGETYTASNNFYIDR